MPEQLIKATFVIKLLAFLLEPCPAGDPRRLTLPQIAKKENGTAKIISIAILEAHGKKVTLDPLSSGANSIRIPDHHFSKLCGPT